MISSALKVSVAALFVGSLVACATPKAGSTSITSADAPAAEQSSSSAPSEKISEKAAAPAAVDAPEGELVCRTASNDGTSELYLTWTGNEARGTLRTIAPSGAVTDLKVRAERNNARIIADDVGSTDLVSHAAVVAEQNGKRRIRLEEMGSARWATCN